MKGNKQILKHLYINLFFFLLMPFAKMASAQCAQCVAAVETNRQAGNDGLAKGLNNGIVYLLCMPYVAIAIVGFVWYKKYRKKGIALNVPSEKFNLN